MNIQLVTSKQDVEHVAHLAHTIWTEHYTPIIGAEQVAYMLATLQSADAIWMSIQHGDVYWLIQENEADIGYVSYSLDADYLFLSKLYLQKEARGKKYGQHLLTQIKEIAAKEKKRRIVLTVNKNNAQSIAAYHALGFTTVREQISDIGYGYVMDDYILELRLS